MNKVAIIVAGGIGKRMGNGTPKQFIRIKGKSILALTLEAFYRYDPLIQIIIALPGDYFKLWNEIIAKDNIKIPHDLVAGGTTRFHSVFNALELAEQESLIGIHDGVRPLVSIQTIERCYKASEEYGTAVPCITTLESVRLITGKKNKPVDRGRVRLVQTPQVFRSEIIKHAYTVHYREDFTDDASVVENAGYKINLVEGNRENIKITTREDLELAEYYLTNIPGLTGR